jgi:methionine-rich copper-binding protein CopC
VQILCSIVSTGLGAKPSIAVRTHGIADPVFSSPRRRSTIRPSPDPVGVPTFIRQRARHLAIRRYDAAAMTIRFVAIVLLVASLAAPAFAHAFLEQANPSAGSQVNGSPPAITMTFSAPVEPRFSLIECRDAGGNRMDTGQVHRGDGKSIAVDLVKLPPGAYSVTWQATSVDTHKTQGHFAFSVRP